MGKRPDGSSVLRYASGSPSKSIVGNRILECVLHAGLGVGQIKDIPTVDVLMSRLWKECRTDAL